MYLSLVGSRTPLVSEFICASELITLVPSNVLTYMDTSSAADILDNYAEIFRSGESWDTLFGVDALSLITKCAVSVKSTAEAPTYLGSAELFSPVRYNGRRLARRYRLCIALSLGYSRS